MNKGKFVIGEWRTLNCRQIESGVEAEIIIVGF